MDESPSKYVVENITTGAGKRPTQAPSHQNKSMDESLGGKREKQINKPCIEFCQKTDKREIPGPCGPLCPCLPLTKLCLDAELPPTDLDVVSVKSKETRRFCMIRVVGHMQGS